LDISAAALTENIKKSECIYTPTGYLNWWSHAFAGTERETFDLTGEVQGINKSPSKKCGTWDLEKEHVYKSMARAATGRL
jgi:hypothetical protein